MTPTVIEIEGSATLTNLAERAALMLSISSTEYEKAKASKNVIDTVHAIQNQIDEACLHLENGDISPDSPVSFYSIQSLSTSTTEEWIDGKTTGKETHSATSQIEVRFRDFAMMGQMVVHFSTVPFVSLEGITWKLTDEKQASLEEEARLEALRQAIKRAHGYAQIIGRDTVTPVKISDPQTLYFGGRMKQTERMMASSATFGIGVGIDFEPQVVEVKASLQVQFHAE